MKERPILFNTENVKAILEGRKTQTRRLNGFQGLNFNPNDILFQQLVNYGGRTIAQFQIVSCHSPLDIACPYGQAGDRLWVRETWVEGYIKTDAWYKADNLALPIIRPEWKASIHMPRWASRITLEITEIRVERVKDISWNDCLAEGVIEDKDGFLVCRCHYSVPQGAFIELWDSINGRKGAYSWESNPWVWVLSFKRL